MASKDAITLLKEGHREAEKLFREFEQAKSEGRKKELAHEICLALSVHFGLEEQIFYPACEGTVDEGDLKEGYVEHDAAKLLVAEIEANENAGDGFFDTKVHVLQEEIEHHIKEEEEPGGIFAQAQGRDRHRVHRRIAGRAQEGSDRALQERRPAEARA
ncbi:MAG TPA: hemerythrin domain-containing protein [Sphingomicrobium sp.]|nr:hemerythrin domain-containing protein [Sphingomicrobium sp.]